jgi:hypothetical protein
MFEAPTRTGRKIFSMMSAAVVRGRRGPLACCSVQAHRRCAAGWDAPLNRLRTGPPLLLWFLTGTRAAHIDLSQEQSTNNVYR